MDHNAPHPSAAFEGYYSKFDLPSGAHLALILCQVKAGEQRPNMVSFTYVPAKAASPYQREIWAEEMNMSALTPGQSFQIDVPGIGYVKWHEDSTAEYKLKCDDFDFEAKTVSRVPWSDANNTPESLLVKLPLPLHWHVHSLASECKFKLDAPADLPSMDRSGTAHVHQEKNWAHSFPSAHMWLQARDGDRGFCCAGGKILGMEAFLLGYRGLSPFMSYTSDWDNREFELSVQGLLQKIVVTAKAPKGSFFSLSSPFPEGHRENFLAQSFQATIQVELYESNGMGPWRLVQDDVFEDASLEFGGEYYPPAGTAVRFH